MLALKNHCLHPTAQKPYIKSSSGGADNSPEGSQVRLTTSMSHLPQNLTNSSRQKDGITHAFVFEFESAEDRDYYVNSDPAHLAFVRSLDGIIEKVQVIDFTPSVF